MKCRLIEVVGVRVVLGVSWGGVDGNPCPNAYGSGKLGCHSADRHVIDGPADAPKGFGGRLDDYGPDTWPEVCAYCGQSVPKDQPERVSRSLAHLKLYNTASGKPEPGDVYWAPWFHGEHKQHLCPWDNCNDPRGHLMVVLPNGHEWDTDSRASNCTMKDDRTHRCWVRHGEPPNLHVDKNGHTCQAGAGSILNGDYHGFLHNGELTDC